MVALKEGETAQTASDPGNDWSLILETYPMEDTNSLALSPAVPAPSDEEGYSYY